VDKIGHQEIARLVQHRTATTKVTTRQQTFFRNAEVSMCVTYV